MVPGFDLFLADALGRLDGRAGGVGSCWRRQVVVERLDRVFQLSVIEEPGEVLGVALRQFDGQARRHAADRACATHTRGASGGLDARGRRTKADHPNVGEDGLADDLGGSDLRCRDRKSTRLNSSHQIISYAVFSLKKKTPLHHSPATVEAQVAR